MPKFTGQLLGYQQEGADFALSSAPYHICGMEMGLGKTATGLYVGCKVGGKGLAVVPAYLRKNWQEEVTKFTEGLDLDIISYTQAAKWGIYGEDEAGNPVFIKLQDGIPAYDYILADEAHYLKNIKAKRSEVFHHLIKKIRPKKLMLMSGTPIKNRVSEFWSLLQLCHYGNRYPQFQPYHKLYYKFCHRYSYERTFEVNGFPIVRFDGVKNAEELKKLIKPVYFRRRAADVLDLPATEGREILIKKSKKFEEDLRKAYELFNINPKDPQYMSLKAANALAKVADSYKIVSDMLENDQKIVLFSCHRDSTRELARRFKVDYIDGTVDADKRHDIIQEWKEKKGGAVLVLTIGAGSTGWNLTEANYMHFNDFPFVPADLEQAKKRIHRIGQDKKCFYSYLFNSDFDRDLFNMIHRKQKDIKKVYE